MTWKAFIMMITVKIEKGKEGKRKINWQGDIFKVTYKEQIQGLKYKKRKDSSIKEEKRRRKEKIRRSKKKKRKDSSIKEEKRRRKEKIQGSKKKKGEEKKRFKDQRRKKEM